MFRGQPTIGMLCVMLEIACDELGSFRGLVRLYCPGLSEGVLTRRNP